MWLHKGNAGGPIEAKTPLTIWTVHRPPIDSGGKKTRCTTMTRRCLLMQAAGTHDIGNTRYSRAAYQRGGYLLTKRCLASHQI